jgi:hypothetical protein
MAEKERIALWLSTVEQWRASGLTQAAFARQQGLHKRQLNYWINRLTPSNGEPALVPVRIKREEIARDLQLLSPSGWRLTLAPDVPALWLIELLRGLA